MIRLLNFFLFCCISCGFISCVSTNHIAGKYGTNFSSMGFFGTTINLKQDSTLEYIFSGDMIHHHITGHYAIYGNKVYMVFDKEILDSNFASGSFFPDIFYKTVYKGDTIKYQRFCYIGHKKLFFANAQTGKKVTKAKRYNKRKKYLIWGSHYYKRRWYLKLRNQ